MDSIVAKNGEIYNCMANQLIYDKNSNKLISYNFDNSNLAKFDFKTQEWSNENTKELLRNSGITVNFSIHRTAVLLHLEVTAITNTNRM